MEKQKSIACRFLGIDLFLVVCLFLIASCYATDKGSAQVGNQPFDKTIYVIGHRGAAGLVPENTLSAFARACSIGVDALELDVLLTADRIVVVHHDFRLKPDLTRTPDGQWLEDSSPPAINDLTLAQLKTYDVGRLKPLTPYLRSYPEQQPVDGERVPTLREVISLHEQQCQRSTELWIEIKTSPENPDLTPSPEVVAAAVVKILREEKISDRTRILSFDWRNLVYIQKIAPDIATVYLSLEGKSLNNIKSGQIGSSPWMAGLDIDDFAGSIPRAIQTAGGRYWAPYYKHVTISNIETAHQLGIQVFVWTPDSLSEMEHLIEIGVDGIITNRPDILKAMVQDW